MPIKTERVIFKVGENSFAITLPKGWVAYKGLRHGDTVEVIANEDVLIRTLSPEGKTPEIKS